MFVFELRDGGGAHGGAFSPDYRAAVRPGLAFLSAPAACQRRTVWSR